MERDILSYADSIRGKKNKGNRQKPKQKGEKNGKCSEHDHCL